MVWIRICRAQNGRRETVEGSSKDRRRIAEGSLTFELKISDLQFCMIHKRNALVFRRHVIATKKARRNHEELTILRSVYFCIYCENINAFCEIEIWENGCNFAASYETNKD